jgi:hypothetical protein
VTALIKGSVMARPLSRRPGSRVGSQAGEDGLCLIFSVQTGSGSSTVYHPVAASCLVLRGNAAGTRSRPLYTVVFQS